MVVKKAATSAKSAPVKAKSAPAKAKKTSAKGKSYVCGVCGLAVTIDTECNCVETCDIICCGQQMEEKKTRKKAKVA